MEELIVVHPVHAQDDLIQVIHLLEFLHDGMDGLPLQFRIQAGKHQANRAISHMPEQLALQTFHIDFSDAMQGTDETRLVEITHDKSLARRITSINRTLLRWPSA